MAVGSKTGPSIQSSITSPLQPVSTQKPETDLGTAASTTTPTSPQFALEKLLKAGNSKHTSSLPWELSLGKHRSLIV